MISSFDPGRTPLVLAPALTFVRALALAAFFAAAFLVFTGALIWGSAIGDGVAASGAGLVLVLIAIMVVSCFAASAAGLAGTDAFGGGAVLARSLAAFKRGSRNIPTM